MSRTPIRTIDLRPSLLLLRLAFAAVMLTAGGLSAAQQEPRAAEPSWSLGDFVNEVRAAQELPGLAIIVVHSDGAPQVFVSGERRIGGGDRITGSDRMHIGSNTKAVTATVIGALVEQGRMTFDTTIGETFPELDLKMHPAYRGVTVRQLLSHAGGIQPYRKRGSLHWTFSLKGTLGDRQRVFTEHVLAERPRFEPGASTNTRTRVPPSPARWPSASRAGRTGSSWRTWCSHPLADTPRSGIPDWIGRRNRGGMYEAAAA